MKVSENISLRGLNSFGVEARAARLVEWETAEELAGVFAGAGGGRADGGLISPLANGRWMALGGGNNMLFTGDFDGTLVKSAARGIEITGETPETLSVRAGAGVVWNDFVEWCIARGVWGVENLSGIPGTVGAAPIQNIGAYGAEVKDVIASVECFAVETGAMLTLAAEHCAFGYRDSVFKGPLRGRVIVTAVDFALSKEPRPNLRYAALAEKVAAGNAGESDLAAIARAVVERRDSKLPDPRTTGNAGSFFKNPVVPTTLAHDLAARYPGMPLYPVTDETPAKDILSARAARTKLAAGWLIEQAGWKGRSEGRVGIHPGQALIVINLGGATGSEIVDFARRVQADVKAKVGVELTPEVNII
jgi:UDP-N-acetylmuramate dehydrogenase